MTIAGTVVGQGTLLSGRFHVREAGRDPSAVVADSLRVGDGYGPFQDVEGLAGVAGGEADEVLERLLRQRHATSRPKVTCQTAFRIGESAPHDRRDLLVGERLQPEDAQPGEEGRVHFEVRVLRRGSDERHRALLDVGEQRILLSLVETVDLVYEQNRLPTVEDQSLASLRHESANLGHAAHHGGDGHQPRARGIRQNSGQAGLAAARGSPEEQGSEMAALQGAA